MSIVRRTGWMSVDKVGGDRVEQVIVSGHDRRAYAALNALGRFLGGPKWRRRRGVLHEVHTGHRTYGVEVLPAVWCDL